MSNDIEYLVKIDGDTAYLAVSGKASYMNCRNVGDYFAKVAESHCKHLVIDLGKCLSMDSTFLGMIAGVALRLGKENADVKLLNLNERNRQLVENLGIYKLVKIARTAEDNNVGGTGLGVSNARQDTILQAHENLVKADGQNLKKFEDVISFLKKERDK